MNEEQDKTEQAVSQYFAAERNRLRAPRLLWGQVEATMASGAGLTRQRRFIGRWPAFAVPVIAAAAIAAILLYVAGPFGGGGGGGLGSAEAVLAAAVDAADDPDSVGLRSYHGIAEIIIAQGSEDSEKEDEEGLTDDPGIVEAQIPDADTLDPSQFNAEMQIWFEEQRKYRVETRLHVEGFPSPPGQVLVTDGVSSWFYDPTLNRYTVTPADSYDPRTDVTWLLGPGSFVGSIEELLRQMEAGNGERAVRLAGEEKVAGRDAYVIEITPSWTSSGTRDDGTEYDESGGVVTYWLDKEFLFSLGWRADDQDGGSFGMRYKEIDVNVEVDDDLFVFTPPAGAVQDDSVGFTTTSSSSSGSTSGDLGRAVHLPAGYLAPTYFLSGYQTKSVGSSQGDEGTDQVDFLIQEDAGDGYISTQERNAGAVPKSLRKGDEITVRGHDAWLREEDGLLHLAWQEDDLVVYMIARGLTKDDLLRVAGSMEVSEGDGGSAAPPVIIDESGADQR